MLHNTVFVSVWLISFNVILSKSIHTAVNAKISVFYGWVALHCIDVPHLLYGYLGYFRIWAIVNSAAILIFN